MSVTDPATGRSRFVVVPASYVLLLRDGTVHASGPIEEVLTAEQLSGAFGLDLLLDRHAGRWTARSAALA